jgi:hypothetical protein
LCLAGDGVHRSLEECWSHLLQLSAQVTYFSSERLNLSLAFRCQTRLVASPEEEGHIAGQRKQQEQNQQATEDLL